MLQRKGDDAIELLTNIGEERKILVKIATRMYRVPLENKVQDPLLLQVVVLSFWLWNAPKV